MLSNAFNIPLKNNINERNIAIIKIPDNDFGYKEVTFKWTESIEESRKQSNQFTFSYHIPFSLLFNPGVEDSSMYVSMTSDEKLELSEVKIYRKVNEIFEYSDGPYVYEHYENLLDRIDYNIILKNKNRCVFRIPRNSFFVINVRFKVQVPVVVRVWSGIGLLIGVFVGIALLIGPQYLQYLSGLAGGIIAGLFALRLVLFHDIELLKLWHIFYIIVIGFVIVSILISIFNEQLSKTLFDILKYPI